jgi:hypothetical protein
MKTIGKFGALAGAAALLAMAGLLCAGCANPLESGEAAPPSGKGYVRVSIGSGFVPRTILPKAEQLYYVLTFTDAGSATVTETLGGAAEKTVALSPGQWDLVVLGYPNPMDVGVPNAEVVNGSAGPFTVSSGTNAPVEVALTAAQTGTGTLRYRLEYPASPAVSGGKLRLEKIGGGFTQTIDLSVGSNIVVGRVPGLSSGYYQLNVYLYNGKLAIVSDLAHIYDNIDTEAKLVLEAGNFAEASNLSALNSAIAAAKSAPEGVHISDDGTGIAVGAEYVPQNALDTLEAAIADAEKIVAFYGLGATQSIVDGTVSALNVALSVFNDAKSPGSVPNAATVLYADTGGGDLPVGAAGTSLVSALAWLKDNAESNAAYTIVLGADESLGPVTLGTYYNVSSSIFNNLTNVSLTLKGDAAERVIQLNAPGSLFTVYSGVTLVLEQNITLQGRTDNTAPLVRIENSGAMEMEAGSKITGNTSSSYNGGGVYSSGALTMNGGEISDNTSYGDGGGVYSSGTLTMNGGEISGNTSAYSSAYSSSYGGGVYSYGAFTMNGGAISDNTSSSYSSSYGGGVYSSGAFTMNGGAISGNTSSSSSSSSYGGGVYVANGAAFNLSGGLVRSNTARSGSGVYVTAGSATSVVTFILSGGAAVDPDNTVYLQRSSSTQFAVITVDSLSGSGAIALVEANFGSLGKTIIQKAPGYTGPLPVNRFAFTGPWELNAEGKVRAGATAALGFGETRSGWLTGSSDFHLYRFTPQFNKSYSFTLTRPGSTNSADGYEAVYVSAAWADGSGTLVNNSYMNYSQITLTTPQFVATDTQDIIVMVSGSDYYPGAYTIRYNEE